MNKYRFIIFDADHTLIDFDADERRAFRAAFAAAGAGYTEEQVETCWAFSAKNWEDLGLNAVHLPAVQEGYHRMYREHVRTLFDFVERAVGLSGKRAEGEEAFLRALRLPSHPIDGAEETVKTLARKYKICVATNGLSDMQRGRLSRLAPYLSELFVSEEMGCIKPNAQFYRAMLARLGARAEECLAVGDSLSSDVAGANAAGMDCVWFNRRGLPLPPRYRVTAQISDLRRLLEIL